MMFFSALVESGRSCCSFWKWIVNSMCCEYGCSGHISHLRRGNADPNGPLRIFSPLPAVVKYLTKTIFISDLNYFLETKIRITFLFYYLVNANLDRGNKFESIKTGKWSLRIRYFQFHSVIAIFKT